MRTVLTYLLAGIGLIGAVDFGLYYLLLQVDIPARSLVFVLLLVSILLSAILGGVIHLRLAAARKAARQRPDRVKVAHLVPSAERVSPIRLDKPTPQPAPRARTLTAPSAPAPTKAPASVRVSNSKPAPSKSRPSKQAPMKSRTSKTAPAKSRKAAPSLKATANDHQLPMPNPPKTPHPVSQKNIGAKPFQQPVAELSIPALLERIHVEGKALAELVQSSKTRLAGTTVSASKAGTVAQEIIFALEARLTRVRELIITRDGPALLRAMQLLRESLTLPSDAIGGLINTERLLTLEMKALPNTLDSLLFAAEEKSKRTPERRVQNFS